MKQHLSTFFNILMLKRLALCLGLGDSDPNWDRFREGLDIIANLALQRIRDMTK